MTAATDETKGIGVNVYKRLVADVALATKITVVGVKTYIGEAKPGSDQVDAVWRCHLIDETTGVVITWADGGNFTQIATDLTTLTYL